VLQYPETYLKVNKLLFSRTQAPPVLSGDLQSVLQGFGNAGFLLLMASGSMILLGVLAIPVLIRRKEKASWEIIGINILLWIGAALVFPNSMGIMRSTWRQLFPGWWQRTCSILSADRGEAGWGTTLIGRWCWAC